MKFYLFFITSQISHASVLKRNSEFSKDINLAVTGTTAIPASGIQDFTTETNVIRNCTIDDIEFDCHNGKMKFNFPSSCIKNDSNNIKAKDSGDEDGCSIGTNLSEN